METSNKLLRSFSCFSYQVKSVLKYHNQDITTGGWPKILNIWKMGKDSVEGNLFFFAQKLPVFHGRVKYWTRKYAPVSSNGHLSEKGLSSRCNGIDIWGWYAHLK